MLLGPAEALANKESLIADRHVLACHGVVGQSTDVATVTQHKQGLFQSHAPEGQEAKRCDQAEQRGQGQRPRCKHAQCGRREADHCGVELDGRPE